MLVIVMVTKCVELRKKKCARYWPTVGEGVAGGKTGGGGVADGKRGDEEAEPQKHGDYTVTLSDLKKFDSYSVSTLQVEYKVGSGGMILLCGHAQGCGLLCVVLGVCGHQCCRLWCGKYV